MKPLTPDQEQEIRQRAGKESAQALAKRLGISKKRVEQALAKLPAPAPAASAPAPAAPPDKAAPAKPAPTPRAVAPSASGNEWVLLLAGGLVVLLLGWFAHAPGLSGRDFHFDDTHALQSNAAIKYLHRKTVADTRTDLGAGGRLARFVWALGPTAREICAYNPYRQVTYWSFALSYLDHPFDQARSPEEFGAHLRQWHATNLRIHLLNALLVVWVAWLTLRAPALRGPRGVRYPASCALVAGLLFATHPLQIQAVAYLSQRAESLCGTFYLLALGLYATARLRSLEGPRRGSAPWLTPVALGGAGAAVVLLSILAMTSLLDFGGLVGGLVLVGLGTAGGLVALVKSGRDEPVHALCQAGCFLSFGLALQSKEVGATLPLAIVAWDLLFVPAALAAPDATPPPGRWWLPRALRTGLSSRARDLGPWALAVLGVILLVVAIGGKKITDQLLASSVEEGGRVLGETVSASEYLLTELNVLCTYLRLYLLPVGQNIEHDYHVIQASPSDPYLWLSFVSGALGAFALICVVRRGDRARVASFALLFALLVLAVTSSVIVLPDVIYEHRVYLPLFGAALVSALLLERAARVWVPERLQSHAVLATGLVVCLVLAGLSRARNRVWEDEITLWKSAVAEAPGKPRSWTNLGLALMNAEEQEVRFRDAGNQEIVMRGSVIDLPLDHKLVYSISAPHQEPAILPPRTIVSIRPSGGSAAGAREAFDKALALERKYTKAWNNKALIAIGEGRARRMEAQLLRRVAKDVAEQGGPREKIPGWIARAEQSEARAQECFREAEQAFTSSLAVKAYDAVLLSNLGNLYMLYLNDQERAYECVNRAWQVPEGPMLARVQAGDLLLRKALAAWEAAPTPDAGMIAARPLWEEARAHYRGYLESAETAEPYRTMARKHLADLERALAGQVADPRAITPELPPQ